MLNKVTPEVADVDTEEVVDMLQAHTVSVLEAKAIGQKHQMDADT